jgi:hypothetical protein
MPEPNPKPFVIITLGPTGAGKTGLVDETIRHCKLKPEPTPRVFLVDDLIVNNEKYKEGVLSIITTNKMTSENVQDHMTKPEVVQAFNDLYWNVRKSKGCVNPESDDCDKETDSQMKTAIQANESFVLEITGNSIPKWLFDTQWLGKDTELYDVFVSCVLVSNLKTLIERNKSRFIKAFNSFITDSKNNAAPRLPNIIMEPFNNIILNIQKTVDDMYGHCVLTKNESKCGKENIDRLLVFSNNEEMRLEFDSKIHNNDTFAYVIKRLYPLGQTSGQTSGNARRRRTQKRRRFHKRSNTKKVHKSIKNKRIRKNLKI